MTKLCVGYVRVSTDEQASTKALENQVQRLKDAGAQQVFYDVESGQEADREGLKQVLNMVGNREVGIVLATRWDRLTRSPEVYLKIKEILRGSDVKLQFLDQDDADFHTASGELYADLQALFSFHEVRSLRERVKHGFQKRRDRKAAWGTTPWGVKCIDECYEMDFEPLAWCGLIHRPHNYSELVNLPDDSSSLVRISKAHIAREVFDAFLEFRSPAKTLNYLRQVYNLQRNSKLIPLELTRFPISDQGLKSWLTNPVFCGHTAYHKRTTDKQRLRKSLEDWEIVRNTHKGIVSEEEFREIQEILFVNRKKHTPIEKSSYLTGIVFCRQCHKACSLKTGGQHKYYGCQHASTTCGNRGCVRLREIDKAIIQALVQKAWSGSEQNGFSKSDFLIQLEQQYESLQRIEGMETSDGFQRALFELQNKINQESNRDDLVAQKMLMNPQARKINFWYSLTQEERRIFYEKLVDRVFINNKRVCSVILKV